MVKNVSAAGQFLKQWVLQKHTKHYVNVAEVAAEAPKAEPKPRKMREFENAYGSLENFDWDGDNLPDGTYFYVLECVGKYRNDRYQGAVMIWDSGRQYLGYQVFQVFRHKG